MTKFNYSLDDINDDVNVYSKRYFLTPEEAEELAAMFNAIEEHDDVIPFNILKDMEDISNHLYTDNKLSEAQQKYVKDIYERYCM
jgi:hypothetical protein